MHRTGIAFMAAVLVAVTAAGAMAAPVTANIPVTQGWNLVGCPAVPLNPDPAAVMGQYSALLLRWDPFARQYVQFDEFAPEDFGNILLGDGYWVFKNSAGVGTISYSGADVSGDHWISLPKAGWTIVGYPNMTPTSKAYEALLVTNGIETKSMADAVAAGWVQDFALVWDSASSSYKSVGLPDSFPDLENLEINKGYWFFTLVDNLALIIPGS
ncbi:MAG: hypothetical protein KatS3mg024_1839 [Armatimonadota bacterium]|nr:MAG: hypothetical protein KatS3mg024_1839 [Armatimonadota bacterium]